MPPEHKALPLTDAQLSDDGPGTLSGYASVFNGVDAYGDTILPGAYTATLPQFLTDGFIGWQHRTDVFPVAIPTVAREEARGLWIEAQFHTDPEAQRARAVVAERLAAGKSMGLSIGFFPIDFEYADGGAIRRLKTIDLVEVSLVLVPADAAARVAAVKAREAPAPVGLDPLRVRLAFKARALRRRGILVEVPSL